MKMLKTAMTGAVLAAFIFAGCAGGDTPASSGTPTSTSTPADTSVSVSTSDTSEVAETDGSASERVFTLDELAAYNGQDGQPAYVAVDGVVYDVTDVPQWAGGEHKNGLTAGHDLTEEITNQSPHGLSVLGDLPVVGRLA